jgi:flagellar biosynthesis protein FliQ
VNENQVIDLALKALVLAGELAAPLLVTALVVGFAISVFQSITQIQESTLSFVPKAIGIGVALLLTGSWMLHSMMDFVNQLYAQIPQLINGA